jgi:rfaE bifunctional protein nucleotidyltransferase chain/domain
MVRSLDHLEGIVTLLSETMGDHSKLVFTNGCFDLLHAGHVRFLEQAKELGSVLVVALNGDESVAMLKGAGRPLNCWNDRAAVLAALQDVDLVVKFEGETELVWLISKLKPHVMCKGEEYFGKPVTGADELTANGGKLVLLEMRKGLSTTNLIKAARGEPVPERPPFEPQVIDISGG